MYTLVHMLWKRIRRKYIKRTYLKKVLPMNPQKHIKHRLFDFINNNFMNDKKFQSEYSIASIE